MKRILYLAFIPAAVFLIAACSGGGEAAKQAAPEAVRPAVAVETAVAAAGALAEGIDVTGTLAPKFEVDVKSEVTGLVSEVYVREWIRVKKGDPLARIDVREQEAFVKRTEAALDLSKSAQLQARVADNRARRELDRMKKLREAGLATEQGLDDAGTEAEAAASRFEAACAQVRATEEELSQVRTRLAKGSIASPLTGIVSECRANVGDLVGEAGANQPLFHIVDNNVLNLTVNVPSGAMAGLRLGQPLQFTTDAFPGRNFTGKVMFMNPAVSQTDRSVRVIAEVQNGSGELKGGLFVKGRIITGQRGGAVLTPREALAGWDVVGRKARLFVVTGDRAAAREVQTGLVTDAGVEIVSGLAPGETYIVRGAFNVKEGDRLIIAGKQGEPAMILSDLSIRRPVFATVMVLVLVTLGIFSYRWLSVEMYPNVEIPVLSIVTRFPGASPESVEREVSKRIEEAVNGISGVKHIYSYSREGVSTVVVEFRLEERINDVTQEARAKVNAARGVLPKGIEDPIIQKLDFNAMPIVSIAIQSQTLPPRDLTILIDKSVKRRFEGIAGVGKVDLVGAAKREVNVVIDPERLSALGLGVDAVVGGLRSENVNTPLGRLNRRGTEYNLRVSGKPDRVDQFRTMVIAERNGRPIRLGEVAEVRDGVEEQRSLGLVNGVPAISLDILKQAGANIVEVADAVKKTAEGLKAELPPGTTLTVVRDSSVFTRESLEDVQQTLIMGGILTILIVFCFINSWRSTVITGITLPISVMSSFLIMKLLGMSLNVMTMMALSLAVGLLIDDAIVVRENIVRHLERGEGHVEAARNGTSEIGLAVFATTLSIVAVFVPVAFMKGIVGRFFFQFGITVAFAVLVSLFVSFTLDPMLSSRWYDPAVSAQGKRRGLGRLLERFNEGFDRAADGYRGMIGWALDNRKKVLTLALAAFAGGIMAFGSLQSAFFPDIDSGEFIVAFKTAPDASIAESRGRLEALLAAIRDIPAISHTYATIGAGDSGTVRSGRVFVKLKERAARALSQKEVQQEFRRRFAIIPGIITSIEEVDETGSSRKPLQVNLRGTEIARLKAYAGELRDRMYAIPGIRDIEISLEHDVPEYRLTVDREKAASAGVTTDQIVRTVGALVGGEVVSTYEDEDGDAVDIRVRLPERLRENPDQVRNLRLAVAGPDGRAALMPLANLISYAAYATPSEINRQELTRQVTISANLDNLPLGAAVEKVKKAAGTLALAPGYRVVFSGDAADMAESFGYMAEALILAVLFVYFILAAQFESFLEPLAIMFSLPLSIVGMAGMLLMTGDTINIMSLIGLIMLMGLVTKNAILLVDYAKVLRGRGMERREAVITAGRTRLRPIVMTTLAMIFGMVPLALAIGAGAEMRAPMARAVVGGLLTSTLLTLLVVPVMYTFMEDLGTWVAGKFGFRRNNEHEDSP